MAEPRPITITQIAEEDFDSSRLPEPMIVVGDLPVSDAVAAIATVATADATDGATAATLANALKVRLNQLITALKA